MPVMKLTQNMISQGIPLPDGVARLEACDQDFPRLYLELRATSPGQGTFYYRYKDAAKKTCHHRLGTTAEVSLADARKQTMQLKALGADPKGAEKAKKAAMTVSDLFEVHVLPRAKIFKRSFARDVEMYNLRIKKTFGAKRLCDLTRGDVELFHSNLLKENLAKATCDNYVKLLRSAYFHALRNEFVDRNVLSGFKLFNADNRVENVPTQEELVRLLKILQTDENRSVCLIAMYLLATGARLSEALGATWGMIDRQNHVWRIPASNSKSKRIRSVPLSEMSLMVLNQLTTEGRHDYLFVNKATDKPYTTIHKVWGRIRRKAGLPKLRLHDLRHCNASWMVSQGISLYIVQEILGHSDPKITMRYSHVANKTLLDASNKASDFIKAAMPINVAIPMELPLLVDLASAREMAISEPVEMAVTA